MKVLHVPYAWHPDPCGGTEVYVRALIAGLRESGWENEVAVGTCAVTGRFSDTADSVLTHRVPAPASLTQSVLYGAGEPSSADDFARLLEERRPDVVHFHAFTPVISVLWLQAARDRGIACVYTYHTPTLACGRGTLLRWGEVPCDGEMKPLRCSACTLHGLGVARPASWALTLFSAVTARLFSRVPFRIWPLMRLRRQAVRRWMGEMNRIVALSTWSKALLERNGVPGARLRLVRHGLACPGLGAPEGGTAEGAGVIRLGFFGRVDRAKGLGLLAEVLRLRPDLNVEVHCHLIGEAAAEPKMQEMLRRLRADARVRVHEAAPPESVVRVMSGYAAVLVPSQGFETGPLVVLEAFAAGVPVIGSDLGGIAEWVTKEVDGLLCPAGDAGAWGLALERFTTDAALRMRLREGVKPPPGMTEVAARMVEVYKEAMTDPG